MKQLEQMYEGKAKKVYATDDPNLVIVDYKDDATAFNGLKKGTIAGKGAINNRMTNMLMQMLLLRYRVVEVPAVMHPRVAGKSIHSGLRPLWYMLRMMFSMLAVVFRIRVLKSGVPADRTAAA